MKCSYNKCKKGRPTFWVEGKGFCNEEHYKLWKDAGKGGEVNDG